MTGEIVAVSVSEKRGMKKENVTSAELVENSGIKGDAHAGYENRQISLLAIESINKMQNDSINLNPGDFGENITTVGLNLLKLPVGSVLKIGKTAAVKITQKGKLCHSRCSIYDSVGDCVMPREGIFGIVVQGGLIAPGDSIEVEK